MTRRFEGRRVLVTGAAQGIGRGVVDRFAAEGATVGLVDLQAGALERVAAVLRAAGVAMSVHAADVSRREEAVRAVQDFVTLAGGIDVAVTAAGIAQVKGVLDLEEHDWRRMIDVNLNGTFFCAQEAARAMAGRDGGSIVLIASINSFVTGKGNAHYSAAKAGVATLAKAAAYELGGQGIRVNAIAPGVVRTAMAALVTENEAYAEAYLGIVPLARFAEPADIAAAAAFLSSEDASYITGHTLVVDDGITVGIDFIPND